MTTEPETKEAAEAELRAAEASVASFDGGTLVHEDGSPNPPAQAELAKRQARVAAAKEAVAKFA
jgi:hypothetical protein